ncbi:MAG: hypothetical protein R3C05_14400 [Pirellulaceae bacterium]
MDMFFARLDYAMTHLGWLAFLTAIYFAGIGLWLAQLIWRRGKSAAWQQRSETFEEYRLLWHRAFDNQLELLEACEIHETSLLQRDATIADLKSQLDQTTAKLNAVVVPPVDADDLTEIITLTRRMETRLNEAGVYRFDQIAAWNTTEQQQFEHLLQQAGCVRDGAWVEQANEILAAASANRVGLDSETAPTTKQTEYARAVRTLQSVAIEIDDSRGVVFLHPPCRIDDLTVIRGIGEINEQCLNNEGIYRLQQIANWTPANVRYFNERLSFKGRIEREQWVSQARRCLKGRNETTAATSLPISIDVDPPPFQVVADAQTPQRRAA